MDGSAVWGAGEGMRERERTNDSVLLKHSFLKRTQPEQEVRRMFTFSACQSCCVRVFFFLRRGSCSGLKFLQCGVIAVSRIIWKACREF